ncbi:MAG: hypothetical protein WED00_01960 [Aquisalimonadaceae bacterium]
MLLIPRLLILLFLLLFGVYLSLFWLVWHLQPEPVHWLEVYAFVTGGLCFIGSLLLIPYGFSLMYGIVPYLDPIVDPSTHRHLRRHGDYQCYRVHRMLFYSASAGSRLFNRRLMPGYDFRQLPRNIRVLLMVEFYGVSSTMFGMVISLGALKLLEMFGYAYS